MIKYYGPSQFYGVTQSGYKLEPWDYYMPYKKGSTIIMVQLSYSLVHNGNWYFILLWQCSIVWTFGTHW